MRLKYLKFRKISRQEYHVHEGFTVRRFGNRRDARAHYQFVKADLQRRGEPLWREVKKP